MSETRQRWREEHPSAEGAMRYVRSDGAVVKYSMGPRHQVWIAFEPDPSEKYLMRSNGRLGWMRRWKTAEAAMRAVDREYPCRAAISRATEDGK